MRSNHDHLTCLENVPMHPLRILTFEVGFQVPTMKPGRSAARGANAVMNVWCSSFQMPMEKANWSRVCAFREKDGNRKNEDSKKVHMM